MTVDIILDGVKEAQQANLRRITELRPSGAFGRAVQRAATEAHRYAVAITHTDTGTLKASHRIRLAGEGGQATGTVYIDPAAVNRYGKRPVEYGPMEHERGGQHAFYARTVAERGKAIADDALTYLRAQVR